MDIDAVGARVRDPHETVRALAVSALASLDDDRALPYLLDASHDPVEQVRSSARGAILERRSSSVAQMLINALGTPNLRRTSAELLTQMGDVATDALVKALEGADVDLKRIVGETLASSGAAEGLIAELSDRSAERRERAIDALGAMRAGHAVDALIGRLEDPDGTVRSKAAEVLGDLGDVRAVEPLKRIFVADPDMDVVAATERSLRKLTGPPSGGSTES
jgi:HEAT repeat protein